MFRHFLTAVIVALFAFYLQYHGYIYWPILNNQPISYEQVQQSYDYIVGAGSAGCIVAARLSEDEDKSVLLIEAGASETSSVYSHIPAKALLMQFTTLDWGYKTVPQTNACLGLNEQVRKCTGWSYKDVLPFFKKMETVIDPAIKPNSKYRGTSGPLKIRGSKPTEFGESILNSAKRHGYKFTQDYNGEYQEGFSRAQVNIDSRGRRSSSAKEYLRPAMKRANLHVLPHTLVTKILLNSDKQATGVEIEQRGFRKVISANKEVIISGGTVNSPQILLLSGIGPKSELEKHNIPVIVENENVGKHLSDHSWSYIGFTLNTSEGTINNRDSDILRKAEYLILGSGRMWYSPIEVMGYVHSGVTPKTDTPDLQLKFFPFDPFVGNENCNNLKPEQIEAARCQKEGKQTFAISSTLQQAKSVGEIRLASKDPHDKVIIDPKYLSDADHRDLKAIARGIKLSIKLITESPEMAKFGPKLAENAVPGCEHLDQWSDPYLECLVRHRTLTLYHPVSTCRMGQEAKTSVVDLKLRVHGVKNLRVIDGSVFPDSITGNTNAAIMMIAEKASDIIRNEA